MSKHIILKTEEHIVLNSNTDIKIHNTNEAELYFSTYPTFEIYLFVVGGEEYIKIKPTNFYEKLKKYCTNNLDYTLLYDVCKDKSIIKIYITPIVISA